MSGDVVCADVKGSVSTMSGDIKKGVKASKYNRAVDALRAICDPIGYMRSMLGKDEQLDGMYAIRISESVSFYQEIAKKALSDLTND